MRMRSSMFWSLMSLTRLSIFLKRRRMGLCKAARHFGGAVNGMAVEAWRALGWTPCLGDMPLRFEPNALAAMLSLPLPLLLLLVLVRLLLVLTRSTMPPSLCPSSSRSSSSSSSSSSASCCHPHALLVPPGPQSHQKATCVQYVHWGALGWKPIVRKAATMRT